MATLQHKRTNISVWEGEREAAWEQSAGTNMQWCIFALGSQQPAASHHHHQCEWIPSKYVLDLSAEHVNNNSNNRKTKTIELKHHECSLENQIEFISISAVWSRRLNDFKYSLFLYHLSLYPSLIGISISLSSIPFSSLGSQLVRLYTIHARCRDSAEKCWSVFVSPELGFVCHVYGC